MFSKNWYDEPTTPELDMSHEDLLRDLAAMAHVPDDQFSERYFSLVAKVSRNFYVEEALMEQIGFPALQSHREQHARVLGGLNHAAPRIMDGNIALGREVITLLPQWFELHASTMDAALAMTLQMSEHRNEEYAAAACYS